MDAPTFDTAPYAIRDDLAAAHENAWDWLAKPGTWLTSAERLAVAAEVRRAWDCALCRERKAALSPYAADETHAATELLSAPAVDLVHRLTTDSGRLRKAWFDEVIGAGLGEGEYVEIAGIVAMTMILDSFRRAIGLETMPLPAPAEGAPSRYRPPGAKPGPAWVAMVAPEDSVESDGGLYPVPQAAFVQRALSSVPASKLAYWALAETHYLPPHAMPDWQTSVRAISRPQIEVIAARVSALHSCFY